MPTTSDESRGVSVYRHHAVMQLYRRNGFVTVTGRVKPLPSSERSTPASPTPQTFERKAHYVIGADGYFSVCRRSLTLELTPVRPSRAFAVCEFIADLRGWKHEACLTFTPDTVNAFWPLGPELGRFTFQVFQSLDESVTLDAFRQLVRERAPWFTPTPEQLCWAAIAPFEHALVRRFGEDRVWLAGDAAHSTSPIGYQSMNRGFLEASSLAAAIATELFEPRAGVHPFARFESEQQAEWARLFGSKSYDAASPWHVNELAPCVPASGEDFEMIVSQLGDAAGISRSLF